MQEELKDIIEEHFLALLLPVIKRASVQLANELTVNIKAKKKKERLECNLYLK